MIANYSLLFYLKKAKSYVSGTETNLFANLHDIPQEVSTGKEYEPQCWNSKANRTKGTSEESKFLNSYLDTSEYKLQIHIYS